MPVTTAWMLRNEAEANYGFRLYQGGAVPGKDIRVVKTGDWDVEACGGTHLKNTSEAGFVKIVYTERVQDGVERIGYSVGLKALKAVQNQERILRRVSESLNAPVEKLDTTAEKLVKELKEANIEKRRLTKELATKEISNVAQQESTTTVEIDGIKLAKRDFKESLDADRWIQTASEMIKRDNRTVAVLFGSDGRNARILVMAGSVALDRGVNAGNIVKEVSPLIGGGGGGRPNFAQGGGTQTEKISEAVKKAEEIIMKQLQH
jgi:alanyl-tRNA synthetase